MPGTSTASFMIGRSSDGRYRVIRREIVYNEEGYPLFATTIGEPGFETKKDARSHARAVKTGEVGGG